MDYMTYLLQAEKQFHIDEIEFDYISALISALEANQETITIYQETYRIDVTQKDRDAFITCHFENVNTKEPMYIKIDKSSEVAQKIDELIDISFDFRIDQELRGTITFFMNALLSRGI